jgi:hypothetical protein
MAQDAFAEYVVGTNGNVSLVSMPVQARLMVQM